MRLERVFHHYEKLEEYHAGLWRIVRGKERQNNIDAAADLLRCPEEFREVLREVIAKWPVSCEANLTSADGNRIAWLGQAACCMSVGAPEENTRAAWHMLTQDEKDEANAVASEVLGEWHAAYKPDRDQHELF